MRLRDEFVDNSYVDISYEMASRKSDSGDQRPSSLVLSAVFVLILARQPFTMTIG